jgi:hypothetical protein
VQSLRDFPPQAITKIIKITLKSQFRQSPQTIFAETHAVRLYIAAINHKNH